MKLIFCLIAVVVARASFAQLNVVGDVAENLYSALKKAHAVDISHRLDKGFTMSVAASNIRCQPNELAHECKLVPYQYAVGNRELQLDSLESEVLHKALWKAFHRTNLKSVTCWLDFPEKPPFWCYGIPFLNPNAS